MNRKQSRIQTYLNQGWSVLQREKPALCFQGQKSALLTESTRMNGPFSAAFFPPRVKENIGNAWKEGEKKWQE